MYYPEGPCTPIVYTLVLKQSLFMYFRFKVCTYMDTWTLRAMQFGARAIVLGLQFREQLLNLLN